MAFSSLDEELRELRDKIAGLLRNERQLKLRHLASLQANADLEVQLRNKAERLVELTRLSYEICLRIVRLLHACNSQCALLRRLSRAMLAIVRACMQEFIATTWGQWQAVVIFVFVRPFAHRFIDFVFSIAEAAIAHGANEVEAGVGGNEDNEDDAIDREEMADEDGDGEDGGNGFHDKENADERTSDNLRGQVEQIGRLRQVAARLEATNQERQDRIVVVLKQNAQLELDLEQDDNAIGREQLKLFRRDNRRAHLEQLSSRMKWMIIFTVLGILFFAVGVIYSSPRRLSVEFIIRLIAIVGMQQLF